MKKITELLSDVKENFKTSMDLYGEAKINISNSLVNSRITYKNTKVKKAAKHLHVIKPN
jgi:hypothetical protein